MAVRKVGERDYVKEQGKLVAQVNKERVSAKDWERNWGFLKEVRPFLEEEAANQGISKEVYWQAVASMRPRYIPYVPVESPHASQGTYPKCSSGMVGRRWQYPLEEIHRPLIPKLPPDEPLNAIFLG